MESGASSFVGVGYNSPVSRTATTLVLGIAVGALTVLLYRRLREVAHDEDPDAIMDRMSRQLQELEHRLGRSEAVCA
jgi:hypothetical protein